MKQRKEKQIVSRAEVEADEALDLHRSKLEELRISLAEGEKLTLEMDRLIAEEIYALKQINDNLMAFRDNPNPTQEEREAELLVFKELYVAMMKVDERLQTLVEACEGKD